MLRRKPFDDDDENPDRWLVSYADFITLLFAFFVVMYSISSVNKGKYDKLASSMGGAFTGENASIQLKMKAGNPSDAASKLKNQQKSLIKPLPLTYLYSEKMRREREALTNMGIDLSNKLSPLISEGKVRVVQNNRGIRIDINDSVLFSPGSAELAGTASAMMNEIAIMLKDNQRHIQVEGHTDNIAIHNATFFSNWELSAVRASSVVRMLSEIGIAENRLSALGFGAAQPITENETPAGRAKNRRVSIMILYESENQDNASLEIIPNNSSNN
jgi:chemotaxis protein MotB